MPQEESRRETLGLAFFSEDARSQDLRALISIIKVPSDSQEESFCDMSVI